MNYITDATERRKCRNERKRTICTKAHELVQKCGGSILVHYKDENDKNWIYCSDEDMYNTYKQKVLESHQRVTSEGKPLLAFPTPSKRTPGDCNFIVTNDKSKENDGEADMIVNDDFSDLATPLEENTPSVLPEKGANGDPSLHITQPTQVESLNIVTKGDSTSSSTLKITSDMLIDDATTMNLITCNQPVTVSEYIQQYTNGTVIPETQSIIQQDTGTPTQTFTLLQQTSSMNADETSDSNDAPVHPDIQSLVGSTLIQFPSETPDSIPVNSLDRLDTQPCADNTNLNVQITTPGNAEQPQPNLQDNQQDYNQTICSVTLDTITNMESQITPTH